MKVKQFLSGTFTLILWAVGIEGVAFFYDLFFHQRATNRFWDTTYNWYPIIGGVIAAAMLLSALRVYIPMRRPKMYRLPEYAPAYQQVRS